MSDVATTCISANSITSGRAITRMPGTALFTVDPKINKQMTPTQLDTKLDNRFDDVRYYSGDLPT